MNRTPEQVKEEHIQALGSEFGSQYNLIFNELLALQTLLNEFKFLYVEDENRMKLMNQTAPFFFYLLQKVFWEYILLGISKITDPSKTGKKKNITINSFPLFIDNEELKSIIQEKIDSILSESLFCRDWRNKWISHYDYEHHLNKEVEPLMAATVLQVKNVLISIEELMNIIHNEFFQSIVAWDVSFTSKGSNALIYFLKKGLENNFPQMEI